MGDESGETEVKMKELEEKRKEGEAKGQMKGGRRRIKELRERKLLNGLMERRSTKNWR